MLTNIENAAAQQVNQQRELIASHDNLVKEFEKIKKLEIYQFDNADAYEAFGRCKEIAIDAISEAQKLCKESN